MKILFETVSDDQIYWSGGAGEGEEPSGSVRLILKLPGGERIPVSIEFGRDRGWSRDWSTELEVPEGTTIERALIQ